MCITKSETIDQNTKPLSISDRAADCILLLLLDYVKVRDVKTAAGNEEQSNESIKKRAA